MYLYVYPELLGSWYTHNDMSAIKCDTKNFIPLERCGPEYRVCHPRGNLAIIFNLDVFCENHCPILSFVTKIGIHDNPYIITYFMFLWCLLLITKARIQTLYLIVAGYRLCESEILSFSTCGWLWRQMPTKVATIYLIWWRVYPPWLRVEYLCPCKKDSHRYTKFRSLIDVHISTL